MLVPEIMSFLGGMVDDLDQARQRLVSEVNKPPRGKRCNVWFAFKLTNLRMCFVPSQVHASRRL
jgi:RecQ-mediated genome instability protein 1